VGGNCRGQLRGEIVASEGVLSIVLGDRHHLFQEAVRSVSKGSLSSGCWRPSGTATMRLRRPSVTAPMSRC